MLRERRVMSRSGIASTVLSASLALTLAGCSDAWNAGPLQYVENEALAAKVKDPGLQDKVRKALVSLYGESPQHIRVPAGSGLPADGLYLGEIVQDSEGADAKFYTIYEDPARTDRPRSTFRQSVVPSVRRAATRFTARTACTAMASPGPAMVPRPRSSTRFHATIVKASSSSPRRSAAPNPIATICDERSRTGSTERRCPRLMRS